ncbi:protein of unknown function [Candidatus Filomicrobium marinum]|uniref:Uncharacterized protein n=1 Tax=Candidatus Filomicrobium marinum TaxID=1608628 RepID=A0A0D6JCM9_9HYPH|nr:protein of unknown function [Candidatus Filomicrobium marinum]
MDKADRSQMPVQKVVSELANRTQWRYVERHADTW